MGYFMEMPCAEFEPSPVFLLESSYVNPGMGVGNLYGYIRGFRSFGLSSGTGGAGTACDSRV